MSKILPAFQTEWMTIINTVWPEIVLPGLGATSNFFTAIQALKKNIEIRMESANPALPYAFLAFGNFTQGTLTGDRNEKNAPVTIFYIDSEKNGATQTSISSKLQTLDDYVYQRNNSNFCLTGPSVIDSSDMNPVLSTLRTMSEVVVIGGIIQFPSVYTATLDIASR